MTANVTPLPIHPRAMPRPRQQSPVYYGVRLALQPDGMRRWLVTYCAMVVEAMRVDALEARRWRPPLIAVPDRTIVRP